MLSLTGERERKTNMEYRHTELNNEELKKLFISGSMPVSYHHLAGDPDKAEEARKKYESGTL